MKILVTGGTGFVGSHCVATLARAGHQIRLLARSPDNVKRVLAPHGSPYVDIVKGDVTNAGDVNAAVAGCDAVLNAANIFSLDARKHDEMYRTNAEGTAIVLSEARAAGCDPIVHVSTTLALYPATEPIPRDPPVGSTAPRGYIGSKRDAEIIARRHQDDGAPVVTTYPGGCWGPHDPGPGEMVHTLRAFLGNRFAFSVRGGMPIADVAWIARAHAALFRPKLGPRRVTMTGTYVRWGDLFGHLRRVTGRWLPMLMPTTAAMALASGRIATFLQPFLPWRLSISYEGSWLIVHSAPTDDSIAIELAGQPPPIEDTIREAIRWTVEAGHMPRSYGGIVTNPRQLTSG